MTRAGSGAGAQSAPSMQSCAGNAKLEEARMGDLEGSTAIVTGAAAGIGAGIARVLAEHGAMVAATDPAAVLSTFRNVPVPPRLATMVEMESLVNDSLSESARARGSHWPACGAPRRSPWPVTAGRPAEPGSPAGPDVRNRPVHPDRPGLDRGLGRPPFRVVDGRLSGPVPAVVAPGQRRRNSPRRSWAAPAALVRRPARRRIASISSR